MKILRVDSEERKIGLSRKRVEWAEEDEEAAEAAAANSRDPAVELKGGIGSTSGPLFAAAAVTEVEGPADHVSVAQQIGRRTPEPLSSQRRRPS